MKKLFILLALLVFAILVKEYFINHPNRFLFALSFTDITKMGTLVEKKPIPLPYIESYVEYPVITGIFIWLSGVLTQNRFDYFLLTGIILSVLAIFSFILCQKIGGAAFSRRIFLFFLLSPTIFLFTVYNWDVLAVFFLLLSVYLYSKNRDVAGTLFLVLGVWAKLFPIFLLPAIILKRFIEKKPRKIVVIVTVFVLVSILINVPFAVKSFKGWSVFFTFSKERGPNIDSIWAGLFVVSDKIFGESSVIKNSYTNFINYSSNISLILLMVMLYFRALRRKYTNLVVLTLGGVLFFLLTSKVYSPPYNYWVLPLIALTVSISFRSFLIFDLANSLVFFIIFQYFYETNILGRSLISFPWYKVAYTFVLVRHLMLAYLSFRIFKIVGTSKDD